MFQQNRGQNYDGSDRTDPPRLQNGREAEREVTDFIETVVDEANAEGVVVNLSGGLDSTVTATLATEALGSENVFGLILPADATAEGNIDDARQVAEELVIDFRIVEIQPLLDRFTVLVTSETREVKSDPLRRETVITRTPNEPRDNYQAAIGNVAARIRMQIAYFEANTRSRLVLGTGNRTELLLGYFTKYGDGGVDLLPIGDLYKTQVRDLSRHLGIHDAIVEKEPTAGLWEGQSDESELGAAYETIDAILHRLIDEEQSVNTISTVLDVEDELVRKYAKMVEQATHKQNPPPSPSTY